MVWLWGNTRSRERARYSSLLPVPGPGGAQPPWPCWMPGLCGAETCFVHASRSHVFLSPGVTQRVRMGGSAGEYLESVCCHGCDGMWPCVCVCVCVHGSAHTWESSWIWVCDSEHVWCLPVHSLPSRFSPLHCHQPGPSHHQVLLV